MKPESKDVRGDETRVVPRADSAYDSNPSFALDLVYNLVFKLAASISDIKSVVLFGRSSLVLSRGITLLDLTFAT